MAKVALVTHDVQTIRGCAGGVAAFVTHFGRLLRAAGDEVTIILTRQETHTVSVDENWRRKYREWGIELETVHNSEPSADRWADPWTVRLSEKVAPLLAKFDIAYFQDWANVAFHVARVKRYNRARLPMLVTVLHGPSDWIRVLNRRNPDIPRRSAPRLHRAIRGARKRFCGFAKPIHAQLGTTEWLAVQKRTHRARTTVS